MTTFNTFANRLAMRLSSFENAAKVRAAAKGIEETIDSEVSIVRDHNKKNNASVSEFGLIYLAYKNGTVPATRERQQVWIAAAIKELRAA